MINIDPARMRQASILLPLARLPWALSCLPEMLVSNRLLDTLHVRKLDRQGVRLWGPHSGQIVRQFVGSPRYVRRDSDGIQPQGSIQRKLTRDEVKCRRGAGEAHHAP